MRSWNTSYLYAHYLEMCVYILCVCVCVCVCVTSMSVWLCLWCVRVCVCACVHVCLCAYEYDGMSVCLWCVPMLACLWCVRACVCVFCGNILLALCVESKQCYSVPFCRLTSVHEIPFFLAALNLSEVSASSMCLPICMYLYNSKVFVKLKENSNTGVLHWKKYDY